MIKTQIEAVLEKAIETATEQKGMRVIESQTDKGKKCVALISGDLRLSTDDFKALMTDIRVAGGFGFMKFFAEHNARLITATGIDVNTFAALCAQYTWAKPADKSTKKSAEVTINLPTTAVEPTGKKKAGRKSPEIPAEVAAAMDILKAFQAKLK
jgi:hypothetical protein